jgi:IS30 family transposase
MSDEEIQDIVMTANLTPRKCLGFLTPFTVHDVFR